MNKPIGFNPQANDHASNPQIMIQNMATLLFSYPLKGVKRNQRIPNTRDLVFKTLGH